MLDGQVQELRPTLPTEVKQEEGANAGSASAGAAMSMRFVGKKLVVKPSSSDTSGISGMGENSGAGTALARGARVAAGHISSRRSLAPSLRKRKQIAPVVSVPCEEDDEDDDNNTSKRRKADSRRPERHKEAHQNKKLREPFNRDSEDKSTAEQEESEPTRLGSLFAAKPVFSSSQGNSGAPHDSSSAAAAKRNRMKLTDVFILCT